MVTAVRTYIYIIWYIFGIHRLLCGAGTDGGQRYCNRTMIMCGGCKKQFDIIRTPFTNYYYMSDTIVGLHRSTPVVHVQCALLHYRYDIIVIMRFTLLNAKYKYDTT